jgi:hypothetical protein
MNDCGVRVRSLRTLPRFFSYTVGTVRKIVVYSDSTYVVDGIYQAEAIWPTNGWVTRDVRVADRSPRTSPRNPRRPNPRPSATEAVHRDSAAIWTIGDGFKAGSQRLTTAGRIVRSRQPALAYRRRGARVMRVPARRLKREWPHPRSQSER